MLQIITRGIFFFSRSAPRSEDREGGGGGGVDDGGGGRDEEGKQVLWMVMWMKAGFLSRAGSTGLGSSVHHFP